ncbi:MAG: HIT family protein [Candidatus Diapherotrites archaeon]|nr:HIT family protein [Candidatus Diapherotrites archaeon]
MSDCLFCKIVKGEIPSEKIWEDSKHLAILDIFPNTKGMTLVLTKKHFDSYAFDMPAEEMAEFFKAAQKVAKILDKKLKVQRTALVMEGLGINHAHLKLYPIYGLDEKFKETWASEKRFFSHYEGYISTQLGPKADEKKLKALAEQLKE